MYQASAASVPEDDPGGFARGFFSNLAEKGIPSAVLHGWEGEFQGPLSDIDFVVGSEEFAALPGIVDGYCQRHGWHLCQILRHETTAAYFVCSRIGRPRTVVALDACSDYQRNGRILMDARDLLENRVPLGSGGYRVGSATELRYCFIKAAEKRKDPEMMEKSFDRYGDNDRAACEEWLGKRWGVDLAGWDAKSLGGAFVSLREGYSAVGLIRPASLRRVIARIIRPTGLLVEAGSGIDDLSRTLMESVGASHFRQQVQVGRAGPGHIRTLVRSGLVVCERASPVLRWFAQRSGSQIQGLIGLADPAEGVCAHLERRCRKRENLQSGN